MAKKLESNIWTMSIVLLVIGLVSSSLLAFVYEKTKEPIELANKKKTLDALAKVLPQFDNEPMKEIVMVPSLNGDSLPCYVARNNGQIVGLAIEAITDKAFSGKFKIIVGFDNSGTIINTMMLDHKETPGLGDKADKSKSNWADQYNGKNPAKNNLAVKKDGGEIDAITAATISSRAYSDAVLNAYKGFEFVKHKLNF